MKSAVFILAVVAPLLLLACETSRAVVVSDCTGERKVLDAKPGAGIAKWLDDHLPDKRICSVTYIRNKLWIVTYQD